jgi:hypothetical protein
MVVFFRENEKKLFSLPPDKVTISLLNMLCLSCQLGSGALFGHPFMNNEKKFLRLCLQCMFAGFCYTTISTMDNQHSV